jgi:hypothetical protein
MARLVTQTFHIRGEPLFNIRVPASVKTRLSIKHAIRTVEVFKIILLPRQR